MRSRDRDPLNSLLRVRVSGSLAARVDNLASLTECSNSAIVRQALALGLERLAHCTVSAA